MSGDLQVWWMVFTGLALGIGCFAWAAIAGYEQPLRRWAWIVAIVLLGIGESFRLMVGIGTTVQGGWSVSWPLVGAIAAGFVLAGAVIRPRVAQWFLVATAVVLPLVLLPGTLGWFGLVMPEITAEHVAGFYSLPALVTAGALFVATERLPRRSPRAPGSGTRPGLLRRAA